MQGGMLARRVFVLFAVFVFFAAIFVENSRASELDDLKKEVERLKTRIETMEVTHPPEHVMDASIFNQFGKNLGAFGDINYFGKSRERKNRTFNIGTLGLYTSADFDNKQSFLAEITVYEHNTTSGINIERLWAGYNFSDALKVRAGRFHTALGYWNTAYHHGRYLFLSVDRPFFIKFEDIEGIIPAHIIGIDITGTVSTAAGLLDYTLEYGNGPGLAVDPHAWMYGKQAAYKLMPNNQFDNNNNKQIIGRVAFKPNAVNGLQLGLSATTFRVQYYKKTTAPPSVVDIDMYENIYGADVVYRDGPIEFLGEYFLLKNGKKSASAYYSQLGYAVGSYTPYVRYESLERKDGDPYLKRLVGGVERHQFIAGVRYDIEGLHSCVKAQYRYDDLDNDKAYNVYEMQWAFHF